jgi:hypothetical protein
MAKPRLLASATVDAEHTLSRYKAVLAQFPGAKVNDHDEFFSTEVNQKYTKWSFDRSNWGVFVSPYCEVPFIFDGKEEIAKVYSKPKRSKVIYTHYDRKDNYKPVIKFARLAFNLKHNAFKDDMLNDCRVEIMTFIQKGAKHKVDFKHLEPRLKKLLAFT